jgi:hypothetical protein
MMITFVLHLSWDDTMVHRFLIVLIVIHRSTYCQPGLVSNAGYRVEVINESYTTIDRNGVRPVRCRNKTFGRSYAVVPKKDHVDIGLEINAVPPTDFGLELLVFTSARCKSERVSSPRSKACL